MANPIHDLDFASSLVVWAGVGGCQSKQRLWAMDGQTLTGKLITAMLMLLKCHYWLCICFANLIDPCDVGATEGKSG